MEAAFRPTGRIVDAADLSTWAGGDPASMCAVCQDTNSAHLWNTHLDPSDLMRFAGARGDAGILCVTHLTAALQSIAPPSPHTEYCSRPSCQRPYAQTWPLHTVLDGRQPTIRACRPCLAEAVATLTTTKDQP